MAGSQPASAASDSWAKDMVFVASVTALSFRRIASSSAGTVAFSMPRACATAASAVFFSASTSFRYSGASKDA